MKTFTKSLSGLLSASALAIGLAVTASPAVAQIAGSVHDMSVLAGAGTNQICVFCHTPHGSADVVGAPLWNKTLTNTAASYTVYVSATMQAGGGTGSVGAVSLACLSCHDGTQARNNTINAPGSGQGSGTTGTLGFIPGGIVNLGLNLGNDHPIGIAFCGGDTAGAGNIADVFTLGLTSCADKDFNAARVGNVGTNYWINYGVDDNNVQQKYDFPLYGTGEVECATCHDPHLGTGVNPVNGLATVTLLRAGNNAASQVCLTCHSK